MSQQDEVEERIRQLKAPIWIGYGLAIKIRDELERLLAHPKMHRMPNLAIIGETNNGKTKLLENFYRRHEPNPDPTADRVTLPILKIQTPPDPDETRLYMELLDVLFAPGPTREPAVSKVRRLKRILVDLDTKMIMLDEFQHALAGGQIRLRKFLNALKYLGNELQISIVVSGTLESLNALQSDPQIANRFEPLFLPKWRMGDDFLRLLVSIEKGLLLQKPSMLAEKTIALRILEESEGTIGEIMRLIRLLAERAIRTGVEQITVDALSPASLKKLEWRRPSVRSTPPI